jgi:hypothetical protein
MFTLDRVAPWGRSFEEYRRMFALSDRDLRVGSAIIVYAPIQTLSDDNATARWFHRQQRKDVNGGDGMCK